MRRPDLMIASADPDLRRRLGETFARERALRRLHEAGDRAETERLVARLTPPVILLDLPLPGYTGLESLQAIQSLSPTTRTIVLVARPEDSDAVVALKQGARGYCSRQSEADLLRRAVQHVRGRVPLEASGGMTLDRLPRVAACGVDYVSVGALTHSAPAADLSLLVETAR